MFISPDKLLVLRQVTEKPGKKPARGLVAAIGAISVALEDVVAAGTLEVAVSASSNLDRATLRPD